MLDSGVGETQINLLLSALNVNQISNNLLKRYERIVGNAVESVATESCSGALEEEIEKTKQANDVVKDE